MDAPDSWMPSRTSREKFSSLTSSLPHADLGSPSQSHAVRGLHRRDVAADSDAPRAVG